MTRSVNRTDSPRTTADKARVFGWGMLFLLAGLLVNTCLSVAFGWPEGASRILTGTASPFGFAQLGVYLLALLAAVWRVYISPASDLQRDARIISDANTYIVRACFWAIVLVGVVDSVISLMRIEDLLEPVFGETLRNSLGRPEFRGLYVHLPLIGIGFVLSHFRQGRIDFVWLCLLIVVAQLFVVMTRFALSYEQPVQTDLVRFWYAAIFLFGSAYTLKEGGHVRVDVFYAVLSPRRKGQLDTIGAVIFGMLFCWVILLLGMGAQSGIIVGPLTSFEISQAGYGLYVKYLMAGFLGVFAATMLVEFVSFFMISVDNILSASPRGAALAEAQ